MNIENYTQYSDVIAPFGYNDNDDDYPAKVKIEMSVYAAQRIIKTIELLKENFLDSVSVPAAEISLKWFRKDGSFYHYDQEKTINGVLYKKIFRPANTKFLVKYDYKYDAENRINVYISETNFGDKTHSPIELSTILDIEAMKKHFQLNSEHTNEHTQDLSM